MEAKKPEALSRNVGTRDSLIDARVGNSIGSATNSVISVYILKPIYLCFAITLSLLVGVTEFFQYTLSNLFYYAGAFLWVGCRKRRL